MSRLILRVVSGLHVDVERLEVDPQWVGRVGDASRGEGVGSEEIAELVVDMGNWYGDQRQQQEADNDCKRSGQHTGRSRVELESSERTCGVGDPGRGHLRYCNVMPTQS